jgi:ribosomal protein S18 acetylase RimI-like enzyme
MSSQNPFAPQTIQLPEHELIVIRLLEAADTLKLVAYFDGLSASTKGYFAPHPFDSATVNTICATLNPNECVRLIATSTANQAIIAYVLLQTGAIPSDTDRYNSLGIDVNPATDCSLAPSIADAYQSQGLGGHLMEKIIAIARTMEKKRIILWGGVQAGNGRAVRYYRKYGFAEMATFEHNGLNYDMCLTLE